MEAKRQHEISVRKIASYWAAGIGLSAAFLSFHGSAWTGGAGLHTAMEVLAAVLAAMVGMLALLRYHTGNGRIFLFVGSGFAGIAFLDAYHAIVTSAYFAPLMPSDLPALIPWSWITSRQGLSVVMFLSWYVWWRSERFGASEQASGKSVYLFTAAVTMACLVFFSLAPLPRAYYPEIVFHRPEEFGPALFLLLALIGYLRKGDWRHDPFEHWLILSLIIGLVGQVVFMSHSARLFDYEFDVAHLLKVGSYACVLTGLSIHTYHSFSAIEKDASQFRTVVGMAVDGFVAIDDHGLITSINDTAGRIFGYTANELIGENINMLMPPPYRDEHDGYLQAFARTGIPNFINIRREMQGRRKDGTDFPLEIHITEFPATDGRRGFISSVRDLSELKDQERALQDIDRRFRDFDDSTQDWHWETDENLRFSFVSNSFERISQGTPPEKVLGKTHRDLGWADDDTQKWRKHEADMVARKPIDEFQYVVMAPRGDERLWSISARPMFNTEGAFTGYRGVGRDITDTKRKEEELASYRGHMNEIVAERTKKLEGQAKQLKEDLREEQAHSALQREFVAMVSHEFRTPLAIIDGAAQRIERRLNEMTPQELGPRVAKIRNAVHRMDDLIESVLSAARLDAGKIEKTDQEIDLGKLLSDVCLRQQEISRSHAITLDVDERVMPIRGDPKLLDHVFVNLLSNAVKYSPDSPRIEVRVWVEREVASIQVRDYGLGVARDEVPRLFERYYRAKTSRGISDSGIGLNLVKALVELHGGLIDVESTEGKGSTFTVRLPVQEARETDVDGESRPSRDKDAHSDMPRPAAFG